MKVKEIMSTELYYVNPEKMLDRVEEVMDWHTVRHVLVIDNKHQLVGVVSQRDMLQTAFTNISEADQREFLRSIPVKKLMRCNVITTNPEMDINEAAWLMIENKIGSLPVLDGEGRVIGIVTSTDFVKLTAQRH